MYLHTYVCKIEHIDKRHLIQQAHAHERCFNFKMYSLINEHKAEMRRLTELNYNCCSYTCCTCCSYTCWDGDQFPLNQANVHLSFPSTIIPYPAMFISSIKGLDKSCICCELYE